MHQKERKCYEATEETVWSCFGDLFWKKHVDYRNKLRQQLSALVKGEVSKTISSKAISPGAVKELCLMAPTGSPESKVFEMVIEKEDGDGDGDGYSSDAVGVQ
jgi:hypothetical protein